MAFFPGQITSVLVDLRNPDIASNLKALSEKHDRQRYTYANHNGNKYIIIANSPTWIKDSAGGSLVILDPIFSSLGNKGVRYYIDAINIVFDQIIDYLINCQLNKTHIQYLHALIDRINNVTHANSFDTRELKKENKESLERVKKTAIDTIQEIIRNTECGKVEIKQEEQQQIRTPVASPLQPDISEDELLVAFNMIYHGVPRVDP